MKQNLVISLDQEQKSMKLKPETVLATPPGPPRTSPWAQGIPKVPPWRAQGAPRDVRSSPRSPQGRPKSPKGCPRCQQRRLKPPQCFPRSTQVLEKVQKPMVFQRFRKRPGSMYVCMCVCM